MSPPKVPATPAEAAQVRALAEKKAVDLKTWHAERFRSRKLEKDELVGDKAVGDVDALGVRPNARMTVASRAYWKLTPAERTALVTDGLEGLDSEALELHGLTKLYELASFVDEVPCDLVPVPAFVEKLLGILRAPKS